MNKNMLLVSAILLTFNLAVVDIRTATGSADYASDAESEDFDASFEDFMLQDCGPETRLRPELLTRLRNEAKRQMSLDKFDLDATLQVAFNAEVADFAKEVNTCKTKDEVIEKLGNSYDLENMKLIAGRPMGRILPNLMLLYSTRDDKAKIVSCMHRAIKRAQEIATFTIAELNRFKIADKASSFPAKPMSEAAYFSQDMSKLYSQSVYDMLKSRLYNFWSSGKDAVTDESDSEDLSVIPTADNSMYDYAGE